MTTRQVSPAVAEVEGLEDRRSPGGGRLAELASTSTDASLRARALVALGRIQDASAAPTIRLALEDSDAAVRDRAAFAAGLLGMSWVPLAPDVRDALAAAVSAADAAHPEDGQRRSFIDALARLGGDAAGAHLASVVRDGGAGDERTARAAIGLGLIAKRDGKMAEAPLQALAGRWGDAARHPRLRHGLAYAFAFSKSPAVRAQALECLKQGSGPAEAAALHAEDERQGTALCARALTEAGTEEDVPALRAALGHRDYRVAAEATRTLVRFAQRAKDNPGRAAAAAAALGDLAARVELLAKGDNAGGGQPLLQLAKLELPDALQPLVASLRQQLTARQRGAHGAAALSLARIDCRLAAAQDRVAGAVDQVLGCGDKLPPEPWRLALALGQIDRPPKSPPAAPLASFLSHPSVTVRGAALAAITAVKDQSAAAEVRKLIGSSDSTLATYAAGAAAALGDASAVPGILQLAPAASRSPDLAEGIASALIALQAPEAQVKALLLEWLQAPHAHLRHVAVQLLQKIGAEVPAVTPEEVPGGDFTPAPDGASLRFTTALGAFTVKLDTAENPRTSANLWGLARKGFFNGLTFHRVEPDFVVQGGDPRGDGDGGPGYSIRCEVSDRRYLRGTIGMALSGKDTGGSQFFFTTSEQPHLEGRYTAFGQVTDGADVLDQLLEGEVIARVEAMP